MKEKLAKSGSDHTDAPVPEFTISPAARCYHTTGHCPPRVCGELASHVRHGRWWFDDAFFCDEHAHAGDEPIGPVRIFRRVKVTAAVLLSGTSMNPSFAQAEAVQRLEAAIAAIGGVLDVEMVHSTFGRCRLQPAGRRGAG